MAVKNISMSDNWYNPSFNLLNGDECAPRPGWSYVHDFILATLPEENILRVVDNTERHPFGSGNLDAIYFIDRGSYWECISKGFTEVNLFKETDREQVNGYGFELVYRVSKERDDKELPVQVFDLFGAIASYIVENDSSLTYGDCLELNEDVQDPSFPVICVALDGKWRKHIQTAFGVMKFMQLIPLSPLEEEIAGGLGSARFIEWLFRFRLPVHSPYRKDVLQRWVWTNTTKSFSLTYDLSWRLNGPEEDRCLICHGLDPSIMAQTLIHLMHHRSPRWKRNHNSLAWGYTQNLEMEADRGDESLVCLFISADGIEALENMIEEKEGKKLWKEGVKWPYLIELEPRLAVDFRPRTKVGFK